MDTIEHLMGFLLLFLTICFAIMEVVQMIEDKLDYLKDIFNYFNVFSAVVNTLMCLTYTLHIPIIDDNDVSFWAAFGVFLMWFNFLYWMRFFSTTAHFIRMIVTTLEDIVPFLIIQGIFIGVIGMTLMFLNFDREYYDDNYGTDSSLYISHFGSRIVDVFLNQYLLLLGEFDLDNMDGRNQLFAWVIFLLATFLS